MKWTESLVLDAIREAYLPAHQEYEQMAEAGMAEEWAMLTHVPLRMAGATTTGAIIDALLVRNWAGKPHGHERLAFEVKVSRSDYRNETIAKRAPTEASAHRCAYAVPAGLITTDELPDGWGLIEVHETVAHARNALGRFPGGRPSRIVWRKYATRREPTCDLDYLVSAAFRRGSRAEERIRVGETAGAEIARIRDENARLVRATESAQRTARRETERARAARNELLAIEGIQECADCGHPIVWRRGGETDREWDHIDPTADAPCRKIRAEADRLRKERDYGTAYAWGFATPIEPRAIRETQDPHRAGGTESPANRIGA